MIIATDEQFDIVYAELKKKCLDSKTVIYMLCALDPDAIAAALILESVLSKEALAYSLLLVSSLSDIAPKHGPAPIDLSTPAVFLLVGLGATDNLSEYFVDGTHWVVVLDALRPIAPENADANPRFVVCLSDPETVERDPRSLGVGLPASFAAYALVRRAARPEVPWAAAVGAAACLLMGRLPLPTYNALLADIQRDAMALGAAADVQSASAGGAAAAALTHTFARCQLLGVEVAPFPLLQFLPPAVIVRTIPRLARRLGLLRVAATRPRADAPTAPAGASDESTAPATQGAASADGAVSPSADAAAAPSVDTAAAPSAAVATSGIWSASGPPRRHVEDPAVFLARSGLSPAHQAAALCGAPRGVADAFERRLLAAAGDDDGTPMRPIRAVARIEGYGVRTSSLDTAAAVIGIIDAAGGRAGGVAAGGKVLADARLALAPTSADRRADAVAHASRLLRSVSEVLVDLLPAVANSFNGAYRTCVIPDGPVGRHFGTEVGLRLAARVIHEALESRIAAPLLIATLTTPEAVGPSVAAHPVAERAASGYLAVAYITPEKAPSVTPAASDGRRLRRAQHAFSASHWGVRNWFGDAVARVAAGGHAVRAGPDRGTVFVPIDRSGCRDDSTVIKVGRRCVTYRVWVGYSYFGRPSPSPPTMSLCHPRQLGRLP